MADISKMSKADLLKQFGPKIVKQFGKDELKFIKNEASGPGGIDRLRSYLSDNDFNAGGLATKKYCNPVKIVDNRKQK